MYGIFSPTAWINATFRKYEILGFGTPVYNDEIIKKMSASERETYLTKYKESLFLNGIDQSKLFSSYVAERTKSLEVAFKAYPTDAFKQETEKSDTVLSDIQEEIKALDAAIAEIGARFHPDNLKDYIKEKHDDILKKIEAIQATELKALQDELKRNFKVNKKKLTDTEKDNIVKTFQKSQQDELENLKKKFTDDLILIHQAAQKERDRVVVLATLREHNPEMKKLLDAAQKDAGARTILSAGSSGPTDQLKGIELKDVFKHGPLKQELKTLSGASISGGESGDELNLSLPTGSWVNPLKWLRQSDPRDLYGADLRIYAQLCKSKWPDSIELNIAGRSGKGEMIARKAYEAFREAGYPADKITISIGGQKQNINPINSKNEKEREAGLFSGGTQAIESRAQHEAQIRDSVKNLGACKNAMQALHKQKQKQAESKKAAAKANTSTDTASAADSFAAQGRRN